MAQPLALTSGEPAGIGPDITIEAWLRRDELKLPPFYLVGDRDSVAKRVLYRAGFRHPGHTEFLAELAASGGRTPQPVMMLWSPALAVVPVTIHLSLREAIAQLSSELILTTARIAVADLKARFGLARPRLAISGLNPHAGEDGSLGREDI